jgi:molybdopterin converting factor small subunit
MEVSIRLFGALKKFGERGIVVVNIPDNCTVLEIRNLIKEQLSLKFPEDFCETLIDNAALASESRVLTDNQQINGLTKTLALLPPVCGG